MAAGICVQTMVVCKPPLLGWGMLRALPLLPWRIPRADCECLRAIVCSAGSLESALALCWSCANWLLRWEICSHPSESPAPAEIWERENWTSQAEQECSCSVPSCIFEPRRNLALQRIWWIQNAVELCFHKVLQSPESWPEGEAEV